ncbi:hypothetical protein NUITMVA2_34190 [Aeromonas caviae]|nr:hypothetical protein NUITMVA2_34190 [Aeromonas caviae]
MAKVLAVDVKGKPLALLSLPMLADPGPDFTCKCRIFDPDPDSNRGHINDCAKDRHKEAG